MTDTKTIREALEQKRKDANQMIVNHKAMNIRADYWEGVNNALAEALAALDRIEAQTDDVREAFERAYGGAWDASHFATFDGTMYHLPESDDIEDPWEYHKELNQDWIAFQRGFRAAPAPKNIEGLVKALEWYGDHANWDDDVGYKPKLEDRAIGGDRGNRAREALALLTDGKGE